MLNNIFRDGFLFREERAINQKIKNTIPSIIQDFKNLDERGALGSLANNFAGKVTFSTSFSLEDQVITDMILSSPFPISIFTLDTGRLFPETYSLWSRTNEFYKTQIKAYYPNYIQLEQFVNIKGPNAFYQSVEDRKQCCHIRKVEPLQRALAGQAFWITGLRAEHSQGRKNLQSVEWDEANKLIKYHPLLNWSTVDVKRYILEKQIPYNTMQDRGFASIGCAPCTRAIEPGEDFRAGRWWWENNEGKECGLHITK